MTAFIATGPWGWVYFIALILASAVTLAGPVKSARRILVCLSVNWLLTRAMVVSGKNETILWQLNDMATCAALVLWGYSRWAMAIAAWVLVTTFVDTALLFGLTSYNVAAGVADATFMAGLLLMMAAAYDTGSSMGGRRILRAGSVGIASDYSGSYAKRDLLRYHAPDDPGMGDY